MRITVASLIASMGYCCEFAFWRVYRQNRDTPLVADRLGVSVRAVQRHKARIRRGELCCRECDGCLRGRLKGLV